MGTNLKSPGRNPNHLLVIRFSAMGDVALVLPALLAVLKAEPNVQFTLLTKAAFAPIFKGQERIQVIGLQNQDIKGLWKLISLALDLKDKYDFGQVIDLHNSLRSRILRWTFRLLGIATFVFEKGRKEKHAWIRSNPNERKPLIHSVLRYVRAFEKAGYKANLIKDSPWIETQGSILKPTNQIGNDNQQKALEQDKNAKIVGLAPFAGFETKNWPLHHIATWIDLLFKQYPQTKLILFGSPSQKYELEKIQNQHPQIFLALDLVKDFGAELDLISSLSLMVSPDSGNMHLAALLKIPVVGIFGSTHPDMGFAPWGQEIHVVQVELYCRPCSVFGQKPCHRGDHACMETLSPEMVMEACHKILIAI